MKNIGIRSQVMLIALVAVAGLIAVAAIYLVSENHLEKVLAGQRQANDRFELLEQVKYDFLSARREEKDFLLRLDDQYETRHAATVGRILTGFEGLKALERDPQSRDLVTRLQSTFSNYVREFATVRKMQHEIGLTPEDGLRGKLRQAVHDVEAKLGEFDQPGLTVTMLMMRRHEKDFLMRKDSKYVDQMAARRVEFSDQLAASPIPPTERKIIMRQMDFYQQRFNKLATIQLDLIRETEMLCELFEDVEPGLKKLATASIGDLAATEQRADESLSATVIKMIGTMALITLFVGFVATTIGRGISGPLIKLAVAMKCLSEDDLDIDIPAQRGSNEIGQMAKAVKVFKDNAVRLVEMQDQKTTERDRNARRRLLQEMAQEFEVTVSGPLTELEVCAGQMQGTSETLLAAAQQAASESGVVAAAAEITSNNVETVAAASEEMSRSIAEISQLMEHTSSISKQAVADSGESTETVQRLSETADRIGEVLALISDIANQTNLLALNATIEAARAGEAGKGFAVVASEVKNLATQTAKATDDISTQISDMQSVTRSAVKAIHGVNEVIGNIDRTAAQVSAAVDQQSVATNEISENAQGAYGATSEISEKIARVSEQAKLTGESARQTKDASSELTKVVSRLKADIDSFVNRLNAA